MLQGEVKAWSGNRFRWLSAACLVAALLATYSNHFHNGFHYDDEHTIVNNVAIRELRNIPHFFRDGTTFSSLPSNQSYRPLVSTLLALDYALGRGLHPFWFHFSTFVLFAALVLLLAGLLERLLELAAPSPRNRWIALAAAAAFGLHPANADPVNYVIASADVIAALGIVASFAIYLAFPARRNSSLFVLPAAISILAKPTAAISPVLLAAYWLLFRERQDQSFRGSRLAATRRQGRSLIFSKAILVSFLICGAVLFFVRQMSPPSWVSGAGNAFGYLITQPYVALLYFKTFFWPAGLSVDYDLGAFTTIRDARLWLGFAFVLLVLLATLVASRSKDTRLIGFGLSWFVIALLPTSLFPLAEVMNDHRAFLSYIGLVIALAGAASLLVQRIPVRAKLIKMIGAVAVLVLVVSACATYQRNKVWQTEATLWHDVTLKSPANARGLMNYGNTLMERGDFKGALDYFHRAQAFAPQYSILMINLGIAEDATGESTLAEQHFRQALQLTPNLVDACTHYGRFLLDHARVAEALPLLEKAEQLRPGDLAARSLLARALSPSAESYLERSLELYRQRRFAEAIAVSQKALVLRPGLAEAWNNIGAAYNSVGQFEKGAAACEEALRLNPDFALARNNLNYAKRNLRATPPK